MDVLEHSVYKFVSIYDAATLARTQQVLSRSMAMVIKGGHLELDGRSRFVIPRDRGAFQDAIDHFLPACKTMVLREADTFLGTARANWQQLLSGKLVKLEELDVTTIAETGAQTLATLPQQNIRRFRVRELHYLYGPLAYSYVTWFGRRIEWRKLEEWDAPPVLFQSRSQIDSALLPSAKTLRRLTMAIDLDSDEKHQAFQRDLFTMFPKLEHLRLFDKSSDGDRQLSVSAPPTLTSLHLHGRVQASFFDDLVPLTQLRELSYTDVSLDGFAVPPVVLARLESYRAPALVYGGIEDFLKRATEAKNTQLRRVVDSNPGDQDERHSMEDVDRIFADFPRLETLGQSVWNIGKSKWTRDKVGALPMHFSFSCLGLCPLDLDPAGPRRQDGRVAHVSQLAHATLRHGPIGLANPSFLSHARDARRFGHLAPV
jgi:hypothetical protein